MYLRDILRKSCQNLIEHGGQGSEEEYVELSVLGHSGDNNAVDENET
jgi:hypothetical protein